MPAPTKLEFDPAGDPITVDFAFDSTVSAQYHLQCYPVGSKMVQAGPGTNTDGDENEKLTVPVELGDLKGCKVFWVIQVMSLPGMSDSYRIIVKVSQGAEELLEKGYSGTITAANAFDQIVGGVLMQEAGT